MVQGSGGELTYLYSIAAGENGTIQSFQYNNSTGRWSYFSEPPHDCLSCDLTTMFNALYDISTIGHFVLDAAGMAPLLGEAFDLVNGIWYIMEDDVENATLSFAATIPLVYTTGVKYVGKIVKLTDGSYQTVKFNSKNAEAFINEVKNLNLDTQTLKVLNDDLNTKAFTEALRQNPELVKAWKVLRNNPVLRKKPENLENISKWLGEGIESQKLADGIAKSKSKQNLIDQLGNAKSKLHAQVLIKDYDNIPGVAKGRYTSNGSTLADKVSLPSGWSDDVDLPVDEIENFTGKIEPLELNPGDKIYRVSHANGAGGPYWTRTKPENLDDVVGGTAVLPEWNNFQYLHEYTIPDGVLIKSWKGKTASQPVAFKPDGTPL
ncbi:MAG: hypothetical protein AAF934_01230, partial [Bacteroidota bacterium]